MISRDFACTVRSEIHDILEYHTQWKEQIPSVHDIPRLRTYGAERDTCMSEFEVVRSTNHRRKNIYEDHISH